MKSEADMILANVAPPVEFQRLLTALFDAANEVRNPPPAAGATSDPADDKFVACALAGRADLIVSSDRHLLDVGTIGGIDVVYPGEAVRRLERRVSEQSG